MAGVPTGLPEINKLMVLVKREVVNGQGLAIRGGRR